MSNYTKDSKNIYFINDKSIVLSLSGDSDLNAIPSQKLFKDTYDLLSSYDNNLSNYITRHVEVSAQNLSTYVKEHCVKKEGDVVAGSLTVEGSLESQSSFIYNGNSDAYTKISVDNFGINASLSGDQRKLKLNLTNSINDVLINGTTLSDHIKNDNDLKSNTAITVAKNYTDAEIDKLSADDSIIAHEFVKGVYESNGIITVYRDKLISDDIPVLLETKISNLTSDLDDRLLKSNFKTSKIDNDGKLLSAADFNLTYDSTTHNITLTAGEKTYNVDATEFIKNKIVDHLDIDEHDGKKWLKIYWTDSTFIEIELTEFIKIYRGSDTISILSVDGGFQLSTTTEVALTSQVNAVNTRITNLQYDNKFDSTKTQVITSLTQSEGEIAYQVKELDNTMIKGLSEYVGQQIGLSVDSLDKSEIRKENQFIYAISETNGIISADSRYVTSADFDVVDGIFRHKLPEKAIENLPTDLENLSTEVSLLNNASVKNVKFINHIYPTEYTPKTSIDEFFKALNLYPKDGNKVINGSIFNVELSGGYTLSDECKIVDGTSNLVLGNGDWLVVNDRNNESYVLGTTLTTIGANKNLYLIKAGTSRYEFEKELADRLSGDTRISTWIAANFANGEDLNQNANTELKKDVILDKSLSVVGNSYVSNLSAATISVRNETSINSTISSANISAANITSADVLTATIDFKNIVDSTGSTVQQISDETSCKIWIEDPTTGLKNYSDLSVIKIEKDKYDQMVANDKILSGNVLYVVSSDYIDAYGQHIKNVATTGVSGESEAANTNYVSTEICAALSRLDQNDYITSPYHRLTALKQIDGKINYDIGTCTSANISDFNDSVNNLIIDKVNTLICSDSAVNTQFVTAVSETNGIITVSRKQPISSDIKDFGSAVDARITNKVNTLDSTLTNNSFVVLTSIVETDGKLASINGRALNATDIPTLSQSKIENLTTDLTAYTKALTAHTALSAEPTDTIAELSGKYNNLLTVLNIAFGLNIE